MTDPNHDIVPTLRMFDGVMTGLAADEIERLRKRVAELEAGALASAPVGLTDDSVLVLKRVLDLLNIINRDGVLKRASELQEVYRLIDTARTGDEHADQA